LRSIASPKNWALSHRFTLKCTSKRSDLIHNPRIRECTDVRGEESAVNAHDNLRELIDKLRAPSPSARQHAVADLAALGARAVPAIPNLVKALRDTSASVRKMAAYALGKIPSLPGGVIQPLIETLQDENPAVQQAAAEALGERGAHAIQALPALRIAARDLHENVRKAAALASRQIQQAIQLKDAA